MDSKPWYLSKTIWLNMLALIAIMVPASAQFISENLSEAGGVFVVLNFFLRVFHTGKAIE